MERATQSTILMKIDTRHSHYDSDPGRVILVWRGRNPTMRECAAAVERQKQGIRMYFPNQLFVVSLGHLEASTPEVTK